MKYILVYNIETYFDNGGGLHFESFTNEIDMTNFVNELPKRFSEPFTIVFSGMVTNEYTYIAIEKVTKYELKRL